MKSNSSVDVALLYEDMSDNLEAVIKGSSTVGLSLWHYFTILTRPI